MKNFRLESLGLLAFTTASILGLLFIRTNTSTPKAYITSFQSDKTVYRSGGEINFTVKIYSSRRGVGLVRVHGIPVGVERVSIKRREELRPGLNEYSYVQKLPSCMGCSGIKPDVYGIESSLKTGWSDDSSEIIVINLTRR